MQWKLVQDCRSELGEGPLWHDDALWWVNIMTGSLNRLTRDRGVIRSRSIGGMLGAAIPTESGHWLLGTDRGFLLLEWESGDIEPVANPEGSHSRIRFNDGKVDPAGRFWSGSMHIDAASGAGSLWRLEPDGRYSRQLSDLTIPNGMAWNDDASQFYFIDSPTRQVDVFDFDLASGTLANRRCAVDLKDEAGDPDGMCIDLDGNLWVAMFGGSQVLQLDPLRGSVLTRIPLPVSQVTSCCFGGDDMSTLFVTSAWGGLRADQKNREPSAGSLFSIRTATTGLRPKLFPFRKGNG